MTTRKTKAKLLCKPLPEGAQYYYGKGLNGKSILHQVFTATYSPPEFKEETGEYNRRIKLIP